MTGTPRPWWASPDAAGPLDDLDPIEAFRTARRSRADTDDGADAAGPPAPHRPELCGICPLCSLARTLEETRPELVEHLTEAARHLAAAARALMEPPDPGPEAARQPSDRLQRIDLERDDSDRTAGEDGGGA
ncbi:MAG: hypothetical protein ACNA8R_00515 [Nitriliruptoraceae bacterium]